MRRIPIRVRVTLVFAAVMAVVLVAVGLFLYLRLDAQLTESLETSLRSRATEVAALTREAGGRLSNADANPLIEQDESFAEIVTADGEVLDSTPQLGGALVLDPEQLTRAAGGATFFTPRGPGDRGRRPRAGGADRARRPAGDRGGGLLARRSRRGGERAGAAAVDRWPDRVAARLAGRILGRRLGAAAGRRDAPASRGDLRARAGGAPPGAGGPRRAVAPRRDPERDARAARAGARARASLRR